MSGDDLKIGPAVAAKEGAEFAPFYGDFGADWAAQVERDRIASARIRRQATASLLVLSFAFFVAGLLLYFKG